MLPPILPRTIRRSLVGALVLGAMAAPAMAQPMPGWGAGWGPGWGYPWGPPPSPWGDGPGVPPAGGPQAPDGPHGSARPHAPREPALIQVTGTGEASVAPDMAVITVGVTVQAATAAEAMAENSARQRQVIDAINARGITGRDIQTSNLSLSPVQNYPDNQPPQITGYQAGNMVTIRVRDLPQLGPILDALVTAGANEVQGISFQRDDAAATEAEARRRAVANARARAEVIAEAAGQRLGRLVSLSDSSGPVGPQPMRRTMALEAAAAPPVETGELSLSAQVSATWEMLPAKGKDGKKGRREGSGPDAGPDSGPDAGPDAGQAAPEDAEDVPDPATATQALPPIEAPAPAPAPTAAGEVTTTPAPMPGAGGQPPVPPSTVPLPPAQPGAAAPPAQPGAAAPPAN